MIVTASEILHGDDFYSKQYGIIFDAMVELHDSAQPVDLITLQNKLKKKITFAAGSQQSEIVKDLLGIVPTIANVANYANIVGKSLLRKLIQFKQRDQKCLPRRQRKSGIHFERRIRRSAFLMVQRDGIQVILYRSVRLF